MPQVSFDECRSAPASRVSGRVMRMIGLGLALALVSLPVRAEDKPMQRTITVSGTAQVTAEPDLARITSGVTIEADTARDALARNSEAMRKVIAFDENIYQALIQLGRDRMAPDVAAVELARPHTRGAPPSVGHVGALPHAAGRLAPVLLTGERP